MISYQKKISKQRRIRKKKGKLYVRHSLQGHEQMYLEFGEKISYNIVRTSLHDYSMEKTQASCVAWSHGWLSR